jgi:hypothetical protein
VPGALDLIIQRLGTDVVAEITGRSRRIVRKDDRLVVENRAASASLAETQAFMDDQKRVLIFSDAGGTGRSYHAELSAKNRRLRVHYLLEAGWKADSAIQGLGRTNRTNQAQPPVFRPIATNVQAEKRFLSTIARRLDTLGAITKGQRQTGGQGMFRPEDNLESAYGRDALYQLYCRLYQGKVEGCSLQQFQETTGLRLTDDTGLREDLPPINTFLNRLLALTIDQQNTLFDSFETLLTARIEGAIAAGVYDMGLETLHADSSEIVGRSIIYTHPGSGAETRLLTVRQKIRNHPMDVETALGYVGTSGVQLVRNARSQRVAVLMPTASLIDEEGEMVPRVQLVKPMETTKLTLDVLADSHWEETDAETFTAAWTAEITDIPEYRDNDVHIVTGLLLPIWKKLPSEGTRVYRLQADSGERVIGRRVPETWAASVTGDYLTIPPAQAAAILRDGRAVLSLADGLELRRVRVMNDYRIELCNFTDSMRGELVACGLFHEIINWKMRQFVPVATAETVLTKLLELYPVQKLSERQAA